MRPSANDSILKSARQFANLIGLTAPNRFPGDQLRANSKRHRARQEEAQRSPLIDASSSDEWNNWEHGLKGTDVTLASDVRAGNNLDEIRTQFPCCDDVGRGQRAWNDDHLFFHCELYRLRIKSVTGQETGTSIQTTARRFCIHHSPRTDNHLRCALHHVLDHFRRLGYG